MATEVECHKCEYEWQYGGGLELATCPNCNTKNKVDNGGPASGSDGDGQA